MDIKNKKGIKGEEKIRKVIKGEEKENKMESKRVLVTGGCGFMGRWIAKSLIEKGYQVYVIDDLSGSERSNIEDFEDDLAGFYEVDLSESYWTRNTIKDIKPEIVFHTAASAREGASFFDPVKMCKTNYVAYMNTLESSIKVGSLDKMVMFSSMAVYGIQPPPFDERMHRKPADIYAINKVAMEHSTEILSEAHDFRYSILRPHNVMGEFQSMKDKYRNVIMIMANRILRNEPILIFGDGEQVRAFSYIQDSLQCYINAMDEKCDGEIINIGGKIPIAINKLADIVKKYMEVDENYPTEHLQDRYGEVRVAYTSYEKSEKLLGYKENVGYEEGIKRTVEWAKEKGAQEWTSDKLALFNSKAPDWWR